MICVKNKALVNSSEVCLKLWLKLHCHILGAVRWNAIGLSNGSILDCTDMKSFLKKLVKRCTFRDLNFNVLAPQTINNRSENFLYFKCVFYD